MLFFVSSHRGSGCWPYQKHGRPANAGMLYNHSSVAVFRVSRWVLSWYPRLLRFRIRRDLSLYQQNLFETPCRNSPLKKRYEVSNIAIFGCSVVSPHQSVSWMLTFPNLPPIFEPFPIVRFGWNFVHRLILGWHFVSFQFHQLEILYFFCSSLLLGYIYDRFMFIIPAIVTSFKLDTTV